MNLGDCPFVHDNIETLYLPKGMSVPGEADLPNVCFCGQPLTYSPHLVFLIYAPLEPGEYKDDAGEVVMTVEKIAFPDEEVP